MSNTCYSWILKFIKAHYYFLIKMPNCSYYLNSWTLKMLLVVNFWLLREEFNLGLKVQVFNRFLKIFFLLFKFSKKKKSEMYLELFRSPQRLQPATTFPELLLLDLPSHLWRHTYWWVDSAHISTFLHFVFWIYTFCDIFVWQCDFSNVKYVLWLQKAGIHCYVWCVYKV